MSKKSLAAAMGFDPSYVSHVEAGRHTASEDFVRRAEQILATNGALWRFWRVSMPDHGASTVAGELVVEDDHAELRYADGVYTATMRRRILNGGTEPVTRYLIRISVDRYPGQPERSNQHYRAHPLRWEDLGLTATCDGEPMRWTAKHDRDSFKEVWLCFDNDRGRFPLYPGQRATLQYAYSVGADKWGRWFQRAVRLPTQNLSVDVILPAGLDPAAWGTETSTTSEAVPLRTPITQDRRAGDVVFSWSATDPPIGARYRLEWRFRAEADNDQVSPALRTSSDRMKAAGIVQAGDPLLTRTAAPFDLPDETDDARDVIERLFAAMQRVREHHVFGKGMGLAAPQIGIHRAAAIVQPPNPGDEPVILLNPRIADESADIDEQYEGCLSFFDVRGMVPRPLRMEVEHARLDGQRVLTLFDAALARLVGHEIDHLHGRLYTDRMRPGTTPIPVEDYRGTGQPWSYPTDQPSG